MDQDLTEVVKVVQYLRFPFNTHQLQDSDGSLDLIEVVKVVQYLRFTFNTCQLQVSDRSLDLTEVVKVVQYLWFTFSAHQLQVSDGSRFNIGSESCTVPQVPIQHSSVTGY